MKGTIWLGFLAVLTPFAPLLRANDAYYDRQEEIRRGAQQLEQYEQRQEEAAKQRYDKAHNGAPYTVGYGDGGDGEIGFWGWVLGGLPLWTFIILITHKFYTEHKAQVKQERQEVIARYHAVERQKALALQAQALAEARAEKNEQIGRELIELIEEAVERSGLKAYIFRAIFSRAGGSSSALFKDTSILGYASGPVPRRRLLKVPLGSRDGSDNC